ncbi:MAG: response regulator [Desulfobacterales bacterium]|nr:response regulator [Desulfobacterales bacterium]
MGILILDDSNEQLIILERFLKKGGFDSIVKADNAEQAYTILGLETADTPSPVDLILLDLLMPNVSGIDVCRKIKSTPHLHDIPIIMVTGMSDAENLEQAFEAGASDYIIKPVKKIELLARVRSAIRLKQEIDQRKSLNAELEQRVLERTAKLEEANQQLLLSSEKAKELARKADAANEAKTRFLANMSHEIRTPLNGIIGLAHLLLETNPTSEQLNYLQNLRASADFLHSLLNDLLDISKLEAGELNLEYRHFNLNEILLDIIKICASHAEQKKLNVTYTIQSEVPMNLYADSARLKQILINLTDNAIKYTSVGHVAILVEKIHETDIEASLRFRIEDTGIGIPKEKIEQLFEFFSMLDDSLTRPYGGIGMGLTISRQLIQLMKGQFGVESEVEKGSVFWFMLTFQKSMLNQDKSSTTTQEPSTNIKTSDGSNATPSPYKILVAEDNAVNRLVVSKMLKKNGYEVDTAEDGLVAIQSLTEKNYDLVLMDVQMPNMDGLSATKTIRDVNSTVLNRDIPIIALTAHAMKEDETRCIEAGMNDYITKPIQLEKLIQTLATYLPKTKESSL